MTIGGAIGQTRRIMLIETLRNILRDVRLAMRALAQRRAFAITVLVTLAVGIGAPTAVFSVLHAVLLNPLPYAEPERIVRFRIESRSPRGTMSFDAMPATTALEWQRSSETLSSVGLFNERALTLTTAQGPYRLNGASVTPNMFELLRVPPLLGRAFDPSATDGAADPARLRDLAAALRRPRRRRRQPCDVRWHRLSHRRRDAGGLRVPDRRTARSGSRC